MRFLPLAITLILGTRLSVIDHRLHRLPNRDVAAMTVVLLVAIVLQVDAQLAWRAVATGLASASAYAVVYLVSRGQFGMGDVKYAFPLGLTVGCYAPHAWLTAILGAFALSALTSLVLIAARRLKLRDRLAFGPYMTVATVVVCLIGVGT